MNFAITLTHRDAPAMAPLVTTEATAAVRTAIALSREYPAYVAHVHRDGAPFATYRAGELRSAAGIGA